MIKSRKILSLTLLTSLIVFAALNASVISAQSQATVNVLESIGGTTDPSGTNTYADGTSVTFTATPDSAYQFVNWIISADTGANTSSIDNPYTLSVTGGTTYDVQAVFPPVLPPPGIGQIPTNMSTAAFVVVLAGAGGTTDPAPGTYALADATAMNIKATADSGWVFDHWVISGPNLSHGGYPFTATPTDNPYNVNHGYGNMYSYQPVFTPTGTTTPTPTVPEFSSIATIVVALALVAIALGTYAYRRKK